VAQPHGFEGFRQCLLRGAREAVSNRNPAYVWALAQMMQNGTDLDEMLERLRPLLRGNELREWYPLLETAERCRDCARAVNTAVRLFHNVPPDEHLRASRVTLGDWMYYHRGSWTIQMHALLERVEQLVKQACRAFLRGRETSWQATQDSILTKVRQMRHALEGTDARPGMRVRHAHGFGYFDAIQEQKLWEFHVVASPDVDMVAWGLEQQVQFRDSWGKRIVIMTANALREVDAAFDRLTTELGWQPLPSQTRP
jgi:hypothetical protein